MKRYTVRLGNVDVVLKSPLKAVKGGVVPHSIIDRKGLGVFLDGDLLTIAALDIPANREAKKTWNKICKFDERRVVVGSGEDFEYTQLECKLHESALGRLLLNCVRVEGEPDLEQQVREWTSKVWALEPTSDFEFFSRSCPHRVDGCSPPVCNLHDSCPGDCEEQLCALWERRKGVGYGKR